MITPQFWSTPEITLSPIEIAEKSATLRKRLRQITSRFSQVRFATSLAAEDMVITDGIAKSGAAITLFTLETGRLHPETVEMIKITEDHYGISIAKIYPQDNDVQVFMMVKKPKKHVVGRAK